MFLLLASILSVAMGQWLFGELIGFQLSKWWSLLKATKDVLSEISTNKTLLKKKHSAPIRNVS